MMGVVKSRSFAILQGRKGKYMEVSKERMIGRDVKRMSNLLRRIHSASPMVKECDDLTGMHGRVLGYLYHESQVRDVFQRDVESAFEMRRSTASEALKIMEENALIIRQSVESDGRLKKIVLTDKAKEISNRVFEEIRETEQKITDGITEKELDDFYRVYDKIKANMLKLLEK